VVCLVRLHCVVGISKQRNLLDVGLRTDAVAGLLHIVSAVVKGDTLFTEVMKLCLMRSVSFLHNIIISLIFKIRLTRELQCRRVIMSEEECY